MVHVRSRRYLLRGFPGAVSAGLEEAVLQVLVDVFLAHPERLRIVTSLRARTDAAARYELIAHHGEAEGTAAAQGVALVEGRLRSAGVRIPAR